MGRIQIRSLGCVPLFLLDWLRQDDDYLERLDMAFDPNKPFETHNGLKATLLSTAGTPNFPIIAGVYLSGTEGGLTAMQFSRDGMHQDIACRLYRLVNIPERKLFQGFVNLYPDDAGYAIHVYKTRESADKHASNNREACVKIEQYYTVGQGREDS